MFISAIKQFVQWLYGCLNDSCLSIRRGTRRILALSKKRSQRAIRQSSLSLVPISRARTSSSSGSSKSGSPKSNKSTLPSVPAPEASVDKITYTLSRAEVVESLNQTLARSSVVQPPSPPPNGTHDSNETHAALGSVTAASYEHSRALSEANTLEALADSAFLCERQGRLAEAEGLYKQVISLSQQKFGQSHLSTAGVLSDLATLYQGQKRYSEAEPLLQRSLRIRTQVLRSNHQDIAETCSQLANVHRYQHRYDRAEPLFQHALTIFRQQLGPKHPRTQAVYDDLMHMLATVIKTGQYSKIVQKLPPLDLENLSDRYPWARPNWHR